MNGSLAGDARECLLAAIRAANPRELTANALRSRHADAGPLPVEVIAVGKAAHGMVRGAIDALGAAIVGGIVIAPEPVTGAGRGVPLVRRGASHAQCRWSARRSRDREHVAGRRTGRARSSCSSPAARPP